MHAAITDEFIAMPVHRINVMLEPVAKRDICLLKEANEEVAKCDLHLWVCQQNQEKGLAPSVGAIIQQKIVESLSPRRLQNRKRREPKDDQLLTSGLGDGHEDDTCPSPRYKTGIC